MLAQVADDERPALAAATGDDDPHGLDVLGPVCDLAERSRSRSARRLTVPSPPYLDLAQPVGIPSGEVDPPRRLTYTQVSFCLAPITNQSTCAPARSLIRYEPTISLLLPPRTLPREPPPGGDRRVVPPGAYLRERSAADRRLEDRIAAGGIVRPADLDRDIRRQLEAVIPGARS